MPSSSPGPLLSILLPVYNEEASLPLLLTRLKEIEQLISSDLEIIFINDGSKDSSLTLLKAAAAQDQRYKVVSFSRNFGHQMAITAGLEHARGQAVIAMDADLQDPPELIAQLLAQWQAGNEIVIAKRLKREGESWFKLSTAFIFYRLLAKATDVPIVLDSGDFYLLDRKVVEVLNACPERARFLRGLVAWAGFKKEVVTYERKARAFGKTNYTLKKMLRLAKDALFGFSAKPISFIHFLTGFSLCVSILAIAYTLYSYFRGHIVPGWSTLMILTSFFGSLILLSLSILGEYIYRIFQEAQGRPKYIIGEKINMDH